MKKAIIIIENGKELTKHDALSFVNHEGMRELFEAEETPEARYEAKKALEGYENGRITSLSSKSNDITLVDEVWIQSDAHDAYGGKAIGAVNVNTGIWDYLNPSHYDQIVTVNSRAECVALILKDVFGYKK